MRPLDGAEEVSKPIPYMILILSSFDYTKG